MINFSSKQLLSGAKSETFARVRKNTSGSWSPNQTIAQKMEGWVIKSVSPDNIIKGQEIKAFKKEAEVLKNGNFKKIYRDVTDININ